MPSASAGLRWQGLPADRWGLAGDPVKAREQEVLKQALASIPLGLLLCLSVTARPQSFSTELKKEPDTCPRVA